MLTKHIKQDIFGNVDYYVYKNNITHNVSFDVYCMVLANITDIVLDIVKNNIERNSSQTLYVGLKNQSISSHVKLSTINSLLKTGL